MRLRSNGRKKEQKNLRVSEGYDVKVYLAVLGQGY